MGDVSLSLALADAVYVPIALRIVVTTLIGTWRSVNITLLLGKAYLLTKLLLTPHSAGDVQECSTLTCTHFRHQSVSVQREKRRESLLTLASIWMQLDIRSSFAALQAAD